MLKGKLFFEKVVNKQATTVKVKDLCRTRWIYRHEAYENFFLLFKFLITTMEAIVSRDYGEMNWDNNALVAANGLLKMYNSFSFIVSFVITMNIMGIIKPISIKLQNRNNDIVKAYSQVQSVIDELTTIRSDDALLHAWYLHVEKVASVVNVAPQVPRTTGRQCHRENTEHDSVEEYYRRCIVLPLLDNLIQQMNERFSQTQITASKLLHLIATFYSLYSL